MTQYNLPLSHWCMMYQELAIVPHVLLLLLREHYYVIVYDSWATLFGKQHGNHWYERTDILCRKCTGNENTHPRLSKTYKWNCRRDNWRAIGRAKKRLKLHESIRTTKMMFGWLNTGTQKKKMGQIETCPCCGIERETQHHLYLCTNENMRNTLIDSIKTAKSKIGKRYNTIVGIQQIYWTNMSGNKDYKPGCWVWARYGWIGSKNSSKAWRRSLSKSIAT